MMLESTASAAVAEYLGSTWSAQQNIHERHRYAVARGRIAPHLFDAGVGTSSAKSIKAATEKITSEFAQQLDKLVAEHEQIRRAANSNVRRFKVNIILGLLKKLAFGSNSSRTPPKKCSRHLTISNTEKAFKEDMRLKSSVTYWTEKGEGHNRKAKWQIGFIAAYFIIAAVTSAAAVWYVFQELVTLLRGMEDKAGPPMFLLAGATLLLVSAVLWIAKLLVKVYFDERYRGQDAYKELKWRRPMWRSRTRTSCHRLKELSC